MGPASAANRTAFGLSASAQDGGERGGCIGEIANAGERAVEAEDDTIVEGTAPTTTAMPAPSGTGTATAIADSIERKNRMGVPAPNDYRDTIELHQVLCMDHNHAGDGGETEGECRMSARATERQASLWNQAPRIQNYEIKMVWMVVRRTSSITANERTDLSMNAGTNIFVIDINWMGETMIRFVIIYDLGAGATRERPARKLDRQKMIRQGGSGTVLAGDFNTHSQWRDLMGTESREAAQGEATIDQHGLVIGNDN